MCASQKLLDQLSEGNKLLEAVQKGLADYLETKRLAFARCGEPLQGEQRGMPIAHKHCHSL
jgi:hypothetical protein